MPRDNRALSIDLARVVLGAIDYISDRATVLEQWQGTVWLRPPRDPAMCAQYVRHLGHALCSGAVTQAIVMLDGNSTATSSGIGNRERNLHCCRWSG